MTQENNDVANNEIAVVENVSDKSEKVITIHTVFARDGLKIISYIMLAQIIMLILLGGLIVILLSNNPAPKYFPINENQQLITPVALDKLGISKQVMFNWVMNILDLGFNYNYHNKKEALEKLIPYFNDSGMQSFIKMLERDENLSRVEEDKLIVSARPSAAPIITRDIVLEGVYKLQVEVPLDMRLENSKILKRQNVTIMMIIVRVNELVNPLGLQIQRLEMKVNSRL